VEITVDAYAGRVYQGRVPDLAALYRSRESVATDPPMRRTLRRVAELIVPLHLTDPDADNFSPTFCESLHDIIQLAHDLAYKEMFRISDIVSDTSGAGAMRLKAPILLDLRIIDLGGGLTGTHTYSRSVTVDQVASVPFRAVLQGMLHEDVRHQGPRPINVEGFLSVMRQQMLAPNTMAHRFGERSYALISDKYLNFSSRIGYHYSVLDAVAGENVSKNHIAFSFKGGAADDVRKNRRARAIASIFEAFDFSVEVREDGVKAHFDKYERSLIEVRLDMIGRLLQFTRQMDMLTQCEESVEVLAKSFLNKNYSLEGERICEISPS
jgi:pyruvate, water dikinase